MALGPHRLKKVALATFDLAIPGVKNCIFFKLKLQGAVDGLGQQRRSWTRPKRMQQQKKRSTSKKNSSMIYLKIFGAKFDLYLSAQNI